MPQENRTHTKSTVSENTEPEIAWHNLRTVCKINNDSQRYHALILRTCECVTSHGKWDFDEINTMDPEMGRLVRII